MPVQVAIFFARVPLGAKSFCYGVAVSACWRSAASRAVALRDTPRQNFSRSAVLQSHEQSLFHIIARGKIFFKGRPRSLGDKYQPHFPALASYGELFGIYVYVSRQGTQFGNTQSGGKKKL